MRGFISRFYFEVLLRPFYCLLLRQTGSPSHNGNFTLIWNYWNRLYDPSKHITSRYNALLMLGNSQKGLVRKRAHRSAHRPRGN